MNSTTLTKPVDLQGLSLALAKTKADYERYVDNTIGSIESPIFIINISVTYDNNSTTYSSNKTFSQIASAFEDGKTCIALLSESSTLEYVNILQLLLYDAYNGVYFGDETNCIQINNENTITSVSNFIRLTYNNSNDTWTSDIKPTIFEPTNGKTWVSIYDGQYSATCPATLTSDISGLTTTKKLTFTYQGQSHHLISTNGITWTKDNTIVDSYSLALNNNVIQLKNGNTVISSVTLPVYNGGVSS